MKLATYCHQMKQCPPLLERNWKNKHFVTRKWPRLCRYFPLNDARMKNGSNENLTSHVWPFFHLISWHVSWLITWHALDRTLRLLSALVPFTCPVATSNRWHHPSDKTVLISVPLSLSLSQTSNVCFLLVARNHVTGRHQSGVNQPNQCNESWFPRWVLRDVTAPLEAHRPTTWPLAPAGSSLTAD